MSGRQLVAATGSTLMVTAAVVAAGLIWLIVADPLSLAALAATGDVIAVVSGIGSRVIAALW